MSQLLNTMYREKQVNVYVSESEILYISWICAWRVEGRKERGTIYLIIIFFFAVRMPNVTV